MIIISVLCIDDWSGLTGWAFSAMFLTEILYFGGMILVERIAEKTEQIITRSALYVLLTAYAVINILVSIIYIAFFKQANTSFVIVEVILLAIIAIAAVVSLAASKGIHQSNENTMNSIANIENMIERLNKLAVSPNCTAYSSALKKLSDDLRFIDISKNVPEDAKIAEAISTIEIEINSDDSTETIKETLVRMNTLIAQRKIAVQASKKGRV